MSKPKYVSPVDQSVLTLENNSYIDKLNNQFPIIDGIPNFIYPPELAKSDLESLSWYKNNAADYDHYLPLTFETFGVDEEIERNKFITSLNLKKDHRVLEIGCGTGRDSMKIARELGKKGELYLQEISSDIFKFCIEKFKQEKLDVAIHFALANGYYLPFKTNFFDRAFHFGGLNTFGNIKRALQELVRVTKVGGRIVVGDENMPIWLRETEFGRVLMNSNPHYKYSLPLEFLPIQARNVKIEWIIGGTFYVISFDVGEGEPYANLDFEIPGIRGGTHKTRYYGQIEGITQETKQLMQTACQKSGISKHKWLDAVIKKAALKELDA